VNAVEILDCPTCAAPAEIQSSSLLLSTDGPVEHVKIGCVRKHWFLLPRDMLTTPAATDVSGESPVTSTVQ
jgi:hypothetical protein